MTTVHRRRTAAAGGGDSEPSPFGLVLSGLAVCTATTTANAASIERSPFPAS